MTEDNVAQFPGRECLIDEVQMLLLCMKVKPKEAGKAKAVQDEIIAVVRGMGARQASATIGSAASIEHL
jgi:hypothetical protein